MRIFKSILLVLLVIFLAIQVFRPAKNLSGATTNDISTLYTVPEDVKVILAKACNDCHSNKTKYPWYSEIQPVSWWLSNHVKDGRRHMNFNEFATYRVAKQYKKLEECIDEVKDGAMPLSSYTILHKDAVLTDAEKQTFFAWVNSVRDSIKAKYPPDSLLIKKN
jgi:hypothetical protein